MPKYEPPAAFVAEVNRLVALVLVAEDGPIVDLDAPLTPEQADDLRRLLATPPVWEDA